VGRVAAAAGTVVAATGTVLAAAAGTTRAAADRGAAAAGAPREGESELAAHKGRPQAAIEPPIAAQHIAADQAAVVSLAGRQRIEFGAEGLRLVAGVESLAGEAPPIVECRQVGRDWPRPCRA
jgi:hypothetical protein